MVDTDRQVPTASASAFSIDLGEVGGPMFVVLRTREDEARATLAKHLVEIGAISNTIEAERLVASAPLAALAVVW